MPSSRYREQVWAETAGRRFAGLQKLRLVRSFSDNSACIRWVGSGWLPGWRPWPELGERIKFLKDRAVELGRDPSEIEVAPQFSVTIVKTAEEAERRYMASGLVAHRKSLAYTGRDLSRQVAANLIGSPDMICEKIAGLAAIGVDHACALMIPADSISEFEEQVQWFAETAYR